MRMEPGKIIYLSWYDFGKQREYICSGEVVDNSDYAGTQWADYVNVSFRPPGFKQPICHHFLPEKLSVYSDNVPHDDCYLVFHKKKTSSEQTITHPAVPADNSSVCCRVTATSPDDAWQSLQRFKQEHWDSKHNHLHTDALDDFYQLWHTAIAAKLGFTVEPASIPSAAAEPQPLIVTEEHCQELKQKMTAKLTRQQLRSTGRIEYSDSIQTSLFD